MDGHIEPEYATVPRAARIVGLTARTLRRAIARGELAACAAGTPHRPRVALDDVRRWVRSTRVPAPPMARALAESMISRCERNEARP
jgi:hypothetical protein